MALHWDVTAIKNHKDVTTMIAHHDDPMAGVTKGEEQWHPVTTTLVWYCVAVGIDRINHKNVGEFLNRMRMQDALLGPILHSGLGPTHLTEADVFKHIGLSTNASLKSRQAFLAGLYRHVDEETKRLGGSMPFPVRDAKHVTTDDWRVMMKDQYGVDV